MRNLTAAETDRHLDLVAILQELRSGLEFHFYVVILDGRRQANFLDVDDLLILSNLALALGLLEAVLSVVHDLADGRLGRRCNLDQIQLPLLCQLERCAGEHDTQLFTVLIDHANLSIANLLINHKIVGANLRYPLSSLVGMLKKRAGITTHSLYTHKYTQAFLLKFLGMITAADLSRRVRRAGFCFARVIIHDPAPSVKQSSNL